MRTVINGVSILDRYLIQSFIPPLIFCVSLSTLLGELIGITFEQIRFIANSSISAKTAFYVHFFKLPAFFSIGLPLALFMASLITFNKLSLKNEIIAFQTFGVSLVRLFTPFLITGLLLSGCLFIFHELLVPPANLKAATLLEQEWNIDRSKLSKYNKRDIVYFQKKPSKSESELDFLFFAHKFENEVMKDIILLRYKSNHISEIIVSHYAWWDERSQIWILSSGEQYLLDVDGYYAEINSFLELTVELDDTLIDYVNGFRDNREMNIFELYHRLGVIKNTGNAEQIRQIEIDIQERYAFPFLCFTFIFLGSSIGAIYRNSYRINHFGIATIVILAYYALQFLFNSLSTVGVVPIFFGVWSPNFIGISFGSFFTFANQQSIFFHLWTPRKIAKAVSI